MFTIATFVSLCYAYSLYNVCYRQSDQLSGTEGLQNRPIGENITI
jgi:hypothetical protein